ncbi:glycoside hydrolase family 16 protein [Actinoplanes sp. KI2]|uniref:glycoside hydrolase family 16 protein n=1 Tax=Actinoplanes sp. KI2 TaxID=2983315 RepID=UPI0021D60CFD|nr:glycoside hydrolase family 16 protein [Actinoplanes sp. KI2]MCU7727899.1 glycoside hydrolase family 16 protein [Actinoplanes sp. KI2]
MDEPSPPGTGGRHAAPVSRAAIVGAAAAVVVLLGAVAAFAVSRSDDGSPVAAPAPRVTVSGSARAAASHSSAAKPATTTSKSPAARAKPATTTKPGGFATTFYDSFDGAAGTGLNRSRYRYDTGPGSKFGTGEIETMTDSTRNVFHDGQGHLVLRALHSGSDPGSGWTSGRFETESASFGAAKGGVVRMEASIRQPDVTRSNGAGYWPAFWMLGNGLRAGGTWPAIGEVDILEDVNGRSSVFGTLHCGVNPGGPCGESSGLGSGEQACGGCRTGFHTYAVEIDRSVSPEQIRWYLDGRNYFTLRQTRVDATTWSRAVDHGFFIIFDLAMGGGFPAAFGGGPNGDTVSGGEMKIDYLAVYAKAG